MRARGRVETRRETLNGTKRTLFRSTFFVSYIFFPLFCSRFLPLFFFSRLFISLDPPRSAKRRARIRGLVREHRSVSGTITFASESRFNCREIVVRVSSYSMNGNLLSLGIASIFFKSELMSENKALISNGMGKDYFVTLHAKCLLVSRALCNGKL